MFNAEFLGNITIILQIYGNYINGRQNSQNIKIKLACLTRITITKKNLKESFHQIILVIFLNLNPSIIVK